MTRGKKATKAARTSTTWCPDCGFHVRGPKHKDGLHHITASERHKETDTRKGIPGRTGEKTKRRRGAR